MSSSPRWRRPLVGPDSRWRRLIQPTRSLRPTAKGRLEPPPKPQQEADWLTEREFARLLTAAARPPRRRVGARRACPARPADARPDRAAAGGADRARLVDLELDGPRPSLLVRCGKGGKPRRQPLAPSLAHEFALLRAEREAPAGAAVFCGLEGKRLQPTILAAIIRRAAERAALEKRVTAHTLRHTAATWLRRQTGDARFGRRLPRPCRPLHRQPLRPTSPTRSCTKRPLRSQV
jgi:integrase